MKILHEMIKKLTLLPWHAVSGFCLILIGAGGIVVVDVVVALVVALVVGLVVGFLVVVARVVDRVVDLVVVVGL